MNTICLSAPVGSCGRPRGSASLPVVAAELAANLEKATQEFVVAADQNPGRLEAEVLRQTRKLQRRAVEAGAQAKADATPPCCPVCRQPLTRRTHGHARTFRTRFGPVTLPSRVARLAVVRADEDAAVGDDGRGMCLVPEARGPADVLARGGSEALRQAGPGGDHVA